jgi:hypothetical protein
MLTPTDAQNRSSTYGPCIPTQTGARYQPQIGRRDCASNTFYDLYAVCYSGPELPRNCSVKVNMTLHRRHPKHLGAISP